MRGVSGSREGIGRQALRLIARSMEHFVFCKVKLPIRTGLMHGGSRHAAAHVERIGGIALGRGSQQHLPIGRRRGDMAQGIAPSTVIDCEWPGCAPVTTPYTSVGVGA